MTRALALAAILLSATIHGAPAAAQPPAPEPPREPTLECAIRLRTLAVGAMVYAQKHDGRLPPDLYSVLLEADDESAAGGPARVRDFAARYAVSSAHAGLLAVPQDVTPDWVNAQSSYRYLGSGEIKESEIQDWGSIVIAHLRLDAGHDVEISPDNPTGELFTLAFLDSHVELMPRAEAEQRIANSLQTLDALRDGTDPPDDRLAVQNLGLILRAVHAYAKASAGRLPPDLGSTLPYVPSDLKRTATGAQRARIFLSPRALKSTHVPDEPTIDWVNANCCYLYLGSPDLALADIPEPYTLVLVHARTDDSFPSRGIDGRRAPLLPLATVGGGSSLRSKTYADWIIAESRRTFGALKGGDPLPDWIHASRDIRIISDAIQAYAAAHEGRLPPDLGATLEFLPQPLPPGIGPPANIYLSPRAERTTQLPDSPTAPWIAANANYVYLGTADLDLKRLQAAGIRVLLHAPLEEPFKVLVPGAELEMIPYAESLAPTALAPKEWLITQIAESRRQLKDLSGTGDPP